MFNQTKSQYQFEIEDQILQINNKSKLDKPREWTQSPTYIVYT